MNRFPYLFTSILILAALVPLAPLLPLALAGPASPQAAGLSHHPARCGEPHTAEPPTGEPDGDEIPCTPTPTPTLTACAPVTETADFARVAAGSSVEGLGTVATDLNIQAPGDAVRIVVGSDPFTFWANNAPGGAVENGDLGTAGGFTDTTAQQVQQAHHYVFAFSPGTAVTGFALHMVDFGDWNPTANTAHTVTFAAFDANNSVVDQQTLSYTTPAELVPRSSDAYGDPAITGDSASSTAGQLGNWLWQVSGQGIVKVTLDMGDGPDPNTAFNGISFTTDCSTNSPGGTPVPTATPVACQPVKEAANFSTHLPGTRVEGLGEVAPLLNIDAAGTAVKVAAGADPFVYIGGMAPGPVQENGGLAAVGGFSDLDAQQAVQAHHYTFTFGPGVTVTDFSLHMLDFGDWNADLSTEHNVTLVGYDAAGNMVDQQAINYTTPAVALPRSSSIYGDLAVTGDATTGASGDPGNWTWHLSGSGITRITLDFGVGFDPNIAFDTLTFATGCP